MQNNQNKFLGCFWKPSESMCFQGVTLKCGVFISAVSDIIIAIWNIYLTVSILRFLRSYGNEDGVHCREPCIAFIFDNILGLICVPFALIGFRGSQKQKVKYLKVYSVFKQIEFIVVFFWTIIYAILVMRAIINTFVFFIIRYCFDFYFTYVVWCAYQIVQDGKNIGLLNSNQNIVQGIQVSSSQSDNFSSAVIQQAAILQPVPVQTIEMQNVREDNKGKESIFNA